MKKRIFLILISLILSLIFFLNCSDGPGGDGDGSKPTTTTPDASYRIAIVDCYDYNDKKKNVRIIETDKTTNYASEDGGGVYVSTPSQGVVGGFFTGNSLYLTHDDPDPATADAHDYIVQVDFEGNVLKQIDLGDDNAPQEMILNDSFIYMPYIREMELLKIGQLDPISGIKKININTGDIFDFEASEILKGHDIGQAFIKKIDNKVYVSFIGNPMGGYAGSKVKIYDASTMNNFSIIDLDNALSNQCQNPKNVTCYSGELYIACCGKYKDNNNNVPGAIVKVDSNGNKLVINLNNNRAKKIISTTNHVYIGLEKLDVPTMYNFDNVFEVNTGNFTIDEQNPIDTGYQIFHFETIDNKIIFTAEKDNKHYVILADENFKILQEIQIYKNVNYPKILCVAKK